MAAIDKIYVTHSWQYDEFKEWCKKQPLFTDKYGKKESILNYLFKYNAGEWHNERPIFMAPYFIDAYVIRNCPYDYIQKELKINYGDDYEKIKDGELYIKPTTNKDYVRGNHFKCTKHPSHYYNRPLDSKYWWVDVFPPNLLGFWYHKDTDSWDSFDEYVISDWTSSCAYVKTIKALKRKIRKWKLPVGTKVRVTGRYMADTYEFKVII